MYALSHRDEAKLKAKKKRLLAGPGEGGRGKSGRQMKRSKRKAWEKEDEKDEGLLQELLSCKHF